MTIKYTAYSITVKAVTGKAVLCGFGYNQEYWVPKSCFEEYVDPDEYERGDEVDTYIATWFLEKNGIDY